ncbi:elongation factor G-binding protein [Paenibacillus yonginensis]|uniref:Elongation factor G-binding protein n=2 Tax=Paenibacillus TaxID=44249 RepID=A0A1B1MX58_9BACL|nr:MULTISPECIES: FusB/FusC family EF-G-binding protein [Paenibacillus]ANS73771.1 elongation factor G-binding protein [Paenibacillus yonginensis]GGA48840.1 elongation factor G-binding protein [Paenibacillus physcomitrellae]
MLTPFMENHEFNLIKRLLGRLEYNIKTTADQKVISAIRHTTWTRVMEMFPAMTEEQKRFFDRIPTLNRAEEFHAYLSELESCVTAFPQVTEQQLKKLYPKIKKLKLPPLSELDFRFLTYIGWADISTNKLFIVYNLDGKMTGIEGRFTPTNKKGVCCLCNKHEEVAFVTAQTKAKGPALDHFGRVGNYMCIDSAKCNQNITDVSQLERFMKDVLN